MLGIADDITKVGFAAMPDISIFGHSDVRERTRAHQQCRNDLVWGNARGVGLHRAGQTAAEWLRPERQGGDAGQIAQ